MIYFPHMQAISIRLPHVTSRIFIGNVLPRVGAHVAGLTGHVYKATVVTDRNVQGYARVVTDSLKKAGFDAATVVLPAGERQKNAGNLTRLWRTFLKHGHDRWSAVVAVGGGVIGDLAGFAAATFMRGVPFFQVPTSFQAQVDASIGGKTAIDLPEGKNLVGAFHQALGIFIDPSVLKTLPRRQFLIGVAEAVKYGVIRDPAVFRMLEADPVPWDDVIPRCVRIKAGVVQRDERERGERMILNYGHTIGHALEKVSNYRFTHGEAISIGMDAEARLAVKLGLSDIVDRQRELLRRFGLPVAHRLDRARVLSAMSVDKKARGGTVRFVLPTRIGGVTYPVPVASDVVASVL